MRLRKVLAVAAPLLALVGLAQSTGTGTLNYTTGLYGQGATSFGSTNYGLLPDFSSALASGYTVVQSIKCTAAPVGISLISGQGGSSSANVPDSWVAINADGTAKVQTYGGGNITGPSIVGSTYHQIMTYFGSGTATLYVDGTQAGTASSNTPTAGLESIGASLNGSFPLSTGGPCIVDEIAYFSGNRHTAESSVPSAAYTGSEPSLLHLYHLDGNLNDSATGGTSGGGGGSTGTIAVSPTSFPLGVATTFTMTGTGTSWISTTRPTVAGGTNAYISQVTVSGQTMTGKLLPGTAAGSLTLGDTTDAASTTATAVANITTALHFDGDSLTRGYKGTGDNTVNAIRLLTVAQGFGPSAVVFQTGVGGQTIAQMTARLASNACTNYQAGKVNYLIIQGAHNDIAAGRTVSQMQADWQAYYAAAKACHSDWRIIQETELPAGNPSAYPATFDATRNTLNTWLRSNQTLLGYYALSDTAKDGLMGQDGQEYNPTYYSTDDSTHPIDAGYTRMAGYDLRAILGPAMTSSPHTGLVF